MKKCTKNSGNNKEYIPLNLDLSEMLEFIPLDLSDLNSVKNFAAVFNEKYDRLDILMNNAGIMALPKR